MNKIPVIGTAIVNGVHWVQRLISTVDYPTENFVIFNNNGRDQITEDLDRIAKIKHPYIDKITVCHLPSNLGVSGAWNLIIKSYMKSPYWIISNHDVAFSPGFLKEMVDAASIESVGMVHGKGGDYGIGGYDLFLIKDWVIQEFGLFDENLYPAYCEDLDHLMRFIHRPIEKINITNKTFLHGYGENYYETGSNTGKDEDGLLDKLIEVNEKNFEYMYQKWGPDWRNLWPHLNPFENEVISATRYDLNYVRQKHLGF